MANWREIDKRLREIKKNDPTKFKELEDTIDWLGMTSLVKARNFFHLITTSVPLSDQPVELESNGKNTDSNPR